MAVKVILPGAQTTVQDRGRYGYQATGISVSGAMDQKAYAQANYLVGNQGDEAALEAVLFGGMLEFTEDTVAAVTGADMRPLLDGIPIEMNRPFEAKAGQSLMLGTVKSGCRTYAAFAGGIDVPVVMGSRSTNLKCRIGGYEGRALKAGDIFLTGKARQPFSQVKDRKVPGQTWQEADKNGSCIIEVRAVPGPQAEYFTREGENAFYSGTYRIQEQSDRMGYRLEGPEVTSVDGTDIISDAIPLGAVQIPPSGQPIVLLADRQTTGGYAKIATVCSFDIPRLVQGKPGDRVRFRKISVEEAQKIYRKQGRNYG